MSAPVRLLRVKHPLEGHLEASLSRLAPELAYVELSPSSEGLELELGERLIVEWSDEDQRARAVVKAREAEGGGALRLTLAMTLTEPDARHYPRLVGGISMRCARRDQALSGAMGLGRRPPNAILVDAPLYLFSGPGLLLPLGRAHAEAAGGYDHGQPAAEGVWLSHRSQQCPAGTAAGL